MTISRIVFIFFVFFILVVSFGCPLSSMKAVGPLAEETQRINETTQPTDSDTPPLPPEDDSESTPTQPSASGQQCPTCPNDDVPPPPPSD